MGGIGDIIEIVVGNDIPTACPVTGTGVNRAGVTCLVEDMGNLVARNLMVITGEGNSLMRALVILFLVTRLPQPKMLTAGA